MFRGMMLLVTGVEAKLPCATDWMQEVCGSLKSPDFDTCKTSGAQYCEKWKDDPAFTSPNTRSCQLDPDQFCPNSATAAANKGMSRKCENPKVK